MGFVRAANRLALVTGLLLAPLAAVVWGGRAAVGLLAGLAWTLANMRLIAALSTFTLRRRLGRNRWKAAALWIVKLPVLYGLGALCLLSPWSSPVGFLAGFSLWFVALVAGAWKARVA